MGYEVFLALQYIQPKRQRGFINLITFISIFGIAISVAALIVVISVMNGFDRDIRDKIIGTNAHVLVNAHTRDGIAGVDKLLKEIRSMDGVVAASPFYLNHGMLKSSAGTKGVMIHGVVPKDHIRVAAMQDMIEVGDFQDLATPPVSNDGSKPTPKVFLGIELLEHLDARVGDKITLFSPVFHMTPAGMMPRLARLQISGVFRTGFYEYDAGLAYMDLKAAQELFEAPGVVTQIGVRVKDLDRAEEIADNIQGLDNGINFWSRDWLRMHDNLFKALRTEKMIMFLILSCMVMVAAFNIVSTLVMIVMEKQKEIGVLKAMGAHSTGIIKIFMVQGLVVGVFGTLFGFIAGLSVCWMFYAFQIPMPGGGQVYNLDFVPIAVETRDLILIFGGSLFASFVATLYPAWNAGHMDPVEAIRYE